MNKQTLSARAPFDPHHQWTPAPPFYGSGAVKAYFALQIFGIFSCFILLITTWLSKTVHRDRSLYNAYVVLATACIFHSLTWFGGYAGTNPEPPGFQLCIAQASLIAGNSTAQPACVAALVFRVSWDSPSDSCSSWTETSFLLPGMAHNNQHGNEQTKIPQSTSSRWCRECHETV
jgi:hypothetical protein